MRRRGHCVIRAIVTPISSLAGKTLAYVNFRGTYKAAIVAVLIQGKTVHTPVAEMEFQVGNVIVLQAEEDSLLLVEPPADFYDKLEAHAKKSSTNDSSSSKFLYKENAIDSDKVSVRLTLYLIVSHSVAKYLLILTFVKGLE
jgi:hypothetical protein